MKHDLSTIAASLADIANNLLALAATQTEPKSLDDMPLPELLANARELAKDVMDKLEDAAVEITQAPKGKTEAAERYARRVAIDSSNALGVLLFEKLDPAFSDLDDELSGQPVEGR